ncbi:MAG: DUF4126 domain-containing protein [Verrucomicrobiales bacterium]|jgi:hypothetical protein|nr:DUF4126 domain-containing protein [Verrucomicrobiales bacterium]MBP9223143.1 DUF4126 domain-containing protein [Verrucomicrobiales bacterium]
MHTLETLAVALGFATLAGLNLYLVVLVTGLAINQGWIDLTSTYPDLMVLGDPLVVTAAGIFFCLEFFSDKIPWVDSLWDSVHTLIRPVGGGLLALHTLGTTDPGFEIVIALLAGGTTLVAHSFKAGTRLAINASPEPVSNILASVTEDVAVLGGLAIMSVNPILAAALCLVFLGTSLYLTPKLFRRSKAFFWLVGSKIIALVSRPDAEKLLYAGLTSSENQKLGAILGGSKADPEWSAKILVGQCKKFPGFTAMTFGRLIAEASSPGSLHFVGRKWMRYYHSELTLEGLEITQEPRFFSEDIVLYDLAGTRKLVLRLPSGHHAMANRIVESLIMRRDAAMPMPSDRIMMAEARATGGAVEARMA